MTPLRHFQSRLLELRQAEQGFALPAALLVTVISFALATAAVFASVETQRGTARDSGSKDAIAAADAAANVAMLRQNEFANDLSSTSPCLGLSSGTLVTTTATEGWCPEITGTVGGATYSYRVYEAATGTTTSIVASATADGASRRVEITLKHNTVGSIFAAADVIGKEKIELNGNGKIEANVATDGEVIGNGNAEVCGNISHGVGKKDSVKQCSGHTVTEGNVSLPPVSSFMPTNIKTENSDNRITYCTKKTAPKEPTGCESDTYNGTWSKTAPFNAEKGTLELSGNETLTLGGENYWVCSVKLSGNSELIIAKGAKVRIFFRTPEECGIKSGGEQLSVSGNAEVKDTGYNPTLGEYEVPGFYLQGSSTIATTAEITGNGADEAMVVYAPNTELSLTGNGASHEGAYVGKTVTASGNGGLKEASGFVPPEIGGSTLYARQGYVECEGGAATSPPNKSC